MDQTRMRCDLISLASAFDDVVVWAARYAHGRSTYAPSMVRSAMDVRRDIEKRYQLRVRLGRVGLAKLDSPMIPSDDLTDVFPPEEL